MSITAEISILSEEERYTAAIKHIKETKEVFVLSDNGGMVTMGTEDEETSIIPFFPTAEAAKAVAKGEWNKCKPESFSLDELVEFILPELAEDEQMISFFPTAEDDGKIIEAQEFENDLK